MTAVDRSLVIAVFATLAIVGGTPRAGRAEPPSDPIEALGAALEDAHTRGDAAAIAAQARLDEPDPWRVADALLARGADSAAEAFARSGPRAATEGLTAYVAARRSDSTPAAVRADRTRRRAALLASDLESAAAPLSEAVLARGDVAAIDVRFVRACALLDARRFPEAIDALADVEKAAAGIGWTARRCAALEKAARAADRSSKFAAGLEFDRTWRGFEESLDCKQGAARSLWHEALLLWKLSRADEARARLEHADRLATEASDDETRALVQHLRAALELNAGHLDRALELTQVGIARLDGAATTTSVERFAPDLRLRAQYRADLGVNAAIATWRLGRREPALELLAEARRRADASGYPASAAFAILTAGDFRAQSGDPLGAAEDYADAAKRFQTAGNLAKEAASRTGLALVRRNLGDPIAAEGELRRVLEIEADVKDLKQEALARRTLAIVLADRGEIDEALAEAERALATARAIGVPKIAAEALRQRGTLLLRGGRYGAALTSFEESADVFRKASLAAEAADATRDAGLARERAGDVESALALYARARADATAAGAEGPRARAALSAGAALLGGGEVEAAEPLVVEAVDAFTHAKDASGLALAQRTLADLRLSRGDVDGALGLARAALSAHVAAHDGAQAMRARIVIASALLREHDAAGALVVVREGLAEAEASGDVVATLKAQWILAAIHKDAGRSLDAIREATAALDASEGLGRDLADGEDAESRATFAPVSDIGAEAALAVGDVTACFRFVESGRARTLLASLGSRDALVAIAIPPELRRAEAEARAKESLARAGLDSARTGGVLRTIREASRALEEVRGRVREAVARIQREAKGRAALTHPAPASIADVRRTLMKDEALVLYASVGDNLVALVVTSDEEVALRVAVLGAAGKIGEAASAFDPAADASERDPLVARLRLALIDPLALPATVRRIIVSPAGPVAALPFRVLVPEREVVMTPSASTHVWLSTEGANGGSRVLALGDPKYAADAVSTTRSHLSPLPAARKEVESIGDRLLLGKEATRRGLAAALAEGNGGKRWKAVHFACHGLVDVSRPQYCALALTPDDTDDGLLPTFDVVRMKIPADLVVLSACETAKGKWVEGEGVLGFVRSFLFAGTSRVICSLWKVDDDATSALMTKFYELWNPKAGAEPMSAAAALKSAQDFVRSQPKWSSPRYWAAWVLWGLP